MLKKSIHEEDPDTDKIMEGDPDADKSMREIWEE